MLNIPSVLGPVLSVRVVAHSSLSARRTFVHTPPPVCMSALVFCHLGFLSPWLSVSPVESVQATGTSSAAGSLVGARSFPCESLP